MTIPTLFSEGNLKFNMYKFTNKFYLKEAFDSTHGMTSNTNTVHINMTLIYKK